MMTNPGDNLELWLGVLTVASVVAIWNIRRLYAVRPALDRLIAMLGAVAILAVVIGVSLVFTEATECAFAASKCGGAEMLVIAFTDLAVSAALISAWLRSDACRAPRVIAIPPTRRHFVNR
jgi:hypothetical protein